MQIKPMIWVLSLLVSSALWGDARIQIENSRDYAILEQFFRMGLTSEEYGYVLEGSKPISIRNFCSLDHFPITKNLDFTREEFETSLLVREAVPIWNRICSIQKNFVLKTVPLKDPESVFPDWEVLFINVHKLREVINKNIDLFRYILGPETTVEQIVTELAYSDRPFMDSLGNNLTLVGIVLGFGTHNSLVGGRVEMISALSISKDFAPFAPQSRLMQSQEEHSLDFLTADRYGAYYLELAGGDDSNFRKQFSLLQPQSGSINLAAEVRALDSLEEPIPQALWKKPRFVFGAYRGGASNQPLFTQLIGAQQWIRILLNKTNFLEQVLEKIAGEKPLITCHRTALTYIGPVVGVWSQILLSSAKQFEDEVRKAAFIEGFCHPSKDFREPPKMVGASKACLEGLKKALRNLEMSNVQFERLSKDVSLEKIVPGKLYFHINSPGFGPELKDVDRVRLGYVIEDYEGNVLFANFDSWLHLSRTIPGFAHGVRGMHVGEKRTLFIHPALAYGVLTTLPPCTALTVKIKLLDIDPTSSGVLPPLTPLDLSWVQDKKFYREIEESLQQQPRFVGSFYRDMLDRIASNEQPGLITSLETQLHPDPHQKPSTY